MNKLIVMLMCFMLPILVMGADQSLQERILHYNIQIIIQQDASIDVTETIRVVANRNQINRGIYRDIPTRYKTRLGDKVNFDLNVLQVAKNGVAEPYHIRDTHNGMRIYIGDERRMLQPGEYTYTIRYRVRHAIGYFDDFDELYWNATGNAWVFPIEQATVSVQLPPGATMIQQAAYTGKHGATEQNYAFNTPNNNLLQYVTTQPLGPYEGLTFAVAWPKGLVYQPTKLESFSKLLRDNVPLVYSLIFLGLLIGFYWLCWISVGRDPQKGTIIPLYEPPEGYPPGLVHYIYYMGFKPMATAFTAAITNLAVKGFVKLECYKGTEFTAVRIKDADDSLGPGESAIMKYLFLLSDSSPFHRINSEIIREATLQFKKAIKREVLGVYFHSNIQYFIFAVIFTIVYMLGLIFILHGEPIFFMFWTSIWTLGVSMLLMTVYQAWKEVAQGKALKIFPALFLTIFSIPFIGGEIVGLMLLSQSIGWSVTAILAVIMFIHYLFFHWLKKPTQEGRLVMDRIEGFRLFLGVANKENIEAFKGPDVTPELFEAYLPYAIALGLEQEWSQKFESSLATAGTTDVRSFSPTWYSGGRTFTGLGAAAIATAIGTSLSSSISTSSTSSSGSGGGGSSGGGGGGGGGGGW